MSMSRPKQIMLASFTLKALLPEFDCIGAVEAAIFSVDRLSKGRFVYPKYSVYYQCMYLFVVVDSTIHSIIKSFGASNEFLQPRS